MKKKKLKFTIIFIIIIILGVGVLYLVNRKEKPVYTTALVSRGKVIQTVSETGTVKSADEINLSFPSSGKINKIAVKIGDLVKKDTVLAELDYSALNINKKEAQANYDVANESLKKLTAGAEYQDLAVAKANLDQAKIAYQSAINELDKTKKSVAESISQAEKNLSDLQHNTANDLTTFEQAIVTADANLKNTKSLYQRAIDNNKQTAINTVDNKIAIGDNALDVIDRLINDENAKDQISVKNIVYLTNTRTDYDASQKLLTAASNLLTSAKASNNEKDTISALDGTLSLLNRIFSALTNCYTALENSVTSSVFSQTGLDNFKANISAQQSEISAAIATVQSAKHSLNDSILTYTTNVDTASQNLSQAQAAYDNALKSSKNTLSSAKITGDQQVTTAQTKVNSAQESMRIAEAQYNKTAAPSNRYDISLAEAKLRQAQTAIDSVNKQIENSIMKSPIDGTITKADFKEGEQITPANQIFSILAQNNFEIEVLISEADIAKVIKGDKAEITLDAFGDETKFNGLVYFIEPAETIIQDVIYYKVKVNFDPAGNNIKSGMTANVIIVTAEKDNVINAPSRAIIEKNGQGKIIRLLVNDQLVEKPVTTGLRGDEGVTEILTGVNEGETVVTYIKDTTK